MKIGVVERENQEIERIELPPLTGGGTGPRLVDGVARIVPRSWLKYHTSIHGRLIMIYPGRVWIKGNIRTRHPWPGDLVRVWCTPYPAAPAEGNPLAGTSSVAQRPPAGDRPAGWRAALAQPALAGDHSLGTPRVWPECTAQSKVVSVLLKRRETIIEIEVFPGQEGWTRLLRLYGQLRRTTPPV